MAPGDVQTVYVIDDDESVRRALRRLLGSAGMAVESFTSAEEFEASVEVCLPACLVLDIHLPRMSGLDLEAKLSGRHPRLPVILMTAHDDAPTRQAADARGRILLHKPFDAERFLSTVQDALETGRIGGER